MTVIYKLKNRIAFQWLACVVGLQLVTGAAVAQLPTQAPPDSGTIRDGNIIDAIKYYAKDIFLVAGLIIATVIFILVTTNAIAVYKEIRDLRMHAGAGAVLIVFVVFLLTQAQDIINSNGHAGAKHDDAFYGSDFLAGPAER